MICKTCKKKFHYCSSCDYIDYYDEGYCSEECQAAGNPYAMQKVAFQKFYRQLNKTQRLAFVKWYDGYLDNYDSRLKGWREEVDENS